MKIKVTRKSLKDMYGKIMIANNIGNILEYLDADYYNSGAYGWNFDAYNVDGVLIIILMMAKFAKRVCMIIILIARNAANIITMTHGIAQMYI